ncbi:MAG: hypothetical protein GX664_03970 [Bacteroidales bacterium]|nr:hypothetical protein [Bacteroidales bacterium]
MLHIYRRAMSQSSITVEQQMTVAYVERLIEHNKQRGGYVPKIYNRPLSVYKCEYCGNNFGSRVQTSKCEECKKREAVYRTLIHKVKRTGKHSDRLAEIEEYYTIQERRGLKVPKIFLKHRGELL